MIVSLVHKNEGKKRRELLPIRLHSVATDLLLSERYLEDDTSDLMTLARSYSMYVNGINNWIVLWNTMDNRLSKTAATWLIGIKDGVIAKDTESFRTQVVAARRAVETRL